MEDFTPQERFNQLLAFLKDPQSHPHPDITPDDFIYINREILIPLQVKVCIQEAIEIMESEMFHQGLLKGNRRTRDIPIENLEMFVLEAAVVILLAKDGGPPDFYYLGSDGQRQPPIEHTLITAYSNMMEAFHQFAKIVFNPPPTGIKGKKLINPSRIRKIQDILAHLLGDAIKKVKEETSFDLVNELILVFLRHVPQAKNYLIATRVFNLVRIMLSIEHNTILKRVKALKKKF